MRDELRSEVRDMLRTNWVLVAGIALLVLFGGGLLVATEVVTRGWSFLAGLFLGLVVAYVVQLRWMFMSMAGFQSRREGIEAEIDTRRILRRLGDDWTVVSNLWFEAFDIDHVVVGPGRVYAIETKWSGSAHDARVRQRLAGVAGHRAAALRRALREHDVEVDVVPVLVLHGRRKGALDAPEMRGGTRVVAAGESKDWLQRMRDAAVPGPNDDRVQRVVEELAFASRDVDG